jgi:hypothetical protein
MYDIYYNVIQFEILCMYYYVFNLFHILFKI